METSHEYTLESLAAELDEWRTSQDRRRRIPESLWMKAAELAKQIGVTRVSTTLRLSFDGLKRRMSVPQSLPIGDGDECPAFLEWLVAPQASACLIKIESPSGARMQVELANISPPALVEILQGFAR